MSCGTWFIRFIYKTIDHKRSWKTDTTAFPLFITKLSYGHNHYRLQVLSCSSFGLRCLTHLILENVCSHINTCICSICSQRQHAYKLIKGVTPFSNDSISLNLPQVEAALSKCWGPEEGNACGWFRNNSELLGDTLLPPPCHALVGSWGALLLDVTYK